MVYKIIKPEEQQLNFNYPPKRAVRNKKSWLNLIYIENFDYANLRADLS